MALQIKHVADLLGKRFCIPSYQRGYRWERKQIEMLLEDLLEFQKKIEDATELDEENRDNNIETHYEDEIGFYCLQPLAVTEKEGEYALIDGQQRLTTIYLILSYLEGKHKELPFDKTRTIKESMYSITYDSREDNFFVEKKFKETEDDTSSLSNIDYYFMTEAYKTIKIWFEQHINDEEQILELLLPRKFRGEDSEHRTRDERLHDVRFIWYETPETNSIETFNNLNYGKISLTSSELVKALLFQCDIYESDKREAIRINASSRSLKWSKMEEALQDDYFWGMLTSGTNVDFDLHLELILQFVAMDIDLENKYSLTEGWKPEEKDWIFNIFSKAVNDNDMKCPSANISLKKPLERIEFMWSRIQKVFTTLNNWFLNRRLYHQIGLLTLLQCQYGKQKIEDVIRDLYEKYSTLTKPQFENYLKKQIGSSVLPSKGQDIKDLRYGQDDKDIRKILLLFNVEETLDQEKEDSKFPFHLASDLYSLEHIHPQNLDNDEISYGDFKTWYDTRKVILKNNKEKLGKEITKECKSAINFLEENLKDENTFNENKSECIRNLSIVDKSFDELADMDSNLMHSLYNMALVYNATNSALGNKLLDEKRNTLKTEAMDPLKYVPQGTWNAFNKYYSQDVKDLKFWSKEDREAYFNRIQTIYNEYTKSI